MIEIFVATNTYRTFTINNYTEEQNTMNLENAYTTRAAQKRPTNKQNKKKGGVLVFAKEVWGLKQCVPRRLPNQCITCDFEA